MQVPNKRRICVCWGEVKPARDLLPEFFSNLFSRRGILLDNITSAAEAVCPLLAFYARLKVCSTPGRGILQNAKKLAITLPPRRPVRALSDQQKQSFFP
jgi:hypothetical protein